MQKERSKKIVSAANDDNFSINFLGKQERTRKHEIYMQCARVQFRAVALAVILNP